MNNGLLEINARTIRNIENTNQNRAKLVIIKKFAIPTTRVETLMNDIEKTINKHACGNWHLDYDIEE